MNQTHRYANSDSRRNLATMACVAALCAAAQASLPPAAAADDHRPPEVTLRVGDRVFAHGVWGYEWTSQSEPGVCSMVAADGVPEFDANPPSVDRGRARLRFAKRQRPSAVTVTAYRSLDANGRPQGSGKELNVSLRPGRRGGKIRSWRARIGLESARTYHLDVTARWRSHDGCAGPQTVNASYSIQIR